MNSHHLPFNLTLRLNYHLHFRQAHKLPAILVPKACVRRPNLDILPFLQP